MTIWTVYRTAIGHGARRWVVEIGSPDLFDTGDMIVGQTLDEIRARMRAEGLTVVPRSDTDPPEIVESWL